MDLKMRDEAVRNLTQSKVSRSNSNFRQLVCTTNKRSQHILWKNKLTQISKSYLNALPGLIAQHTAQIKKRKSLQKMKPKWVWLQKQTENIRRRKLRKKLKRNNINANNTPSKHHH